MYVQGGWAGFLDADHSDGEGEEDEVSEEFQPSSDGDDDDDDSDSDSASVVNSSDEDDDVRLSAPRRLCLGLCGSTLPAAARCVLSMAILYYSLH